MVAIINYGVGNMGSILNMLKRIGANALITSDPFMINKAKHIILPGVGNFDYGIQQLNKAGLIDVLNYQVQELKKPILGICLGVQLFTESSEEGKLPGLGWIKGRTVKFNQADFGNNNLKIPHMGWSDVSIKSSSRIFENFYSDPRFYFVHSYHLSCNNDHDVLCTSDYGYEFAAGVERENIIGVQFHPEKSHKFGLKLYENFIKNY